MVQTTGNEAVEDASFSFEVVLDQLALKLKAMTHEISDLHFKKVILERENALYVKKAQHGLGFSLAPDASAPPSAVGVQSAPLSLPTTHTSITTNSPNALTDVTNLEPKQSISSTTAEENLVPSVKASVQKERNRDHEKENAITLLNERPATTRSGSRREKDASLNNKHKRSGKREEREITKERRARLNLLQRTASSNNIRL